MSFTTDEQLMLLAARSEPSEDACRRMRELTAGPLDWDRFVRTSVRHGVAPLAHRGLAVALGDDGEGVPPAAHAELAGLATKSTARNKRLLAVLGDVLAALGSRGIRPLALKDLGLVLETFPHVGLRPLGDLDLLIAREQYDDVAQTLRELGFESRMSPAATFTREHGWGHHFRRQHDNVWLDIQWNVLQREWGEPTVGRRSFDPDVLREGSYEVALPGRSSSKMRLGSAEATLFHLCSHLEGHEYGELILFCDIAEVLQRQGTKLDWARLVDIAERFEANATVFWVLDLAHRLLDAPLPPPETMTVLAGDTFRGAVYPAIFGGLGALHYSLDDIEAQIAPPRPLLRRLAADVREHAACARALYHEVDGIVHDFSAAAGELMVLASDGSGRRFPDPQLDPFGVVELVVLEHDCERLEAVCTSRGYAASAGGEIVRVVDAESGPLEVQIQTARGSSLFEARARTLTNREIARRSFARRLRREPATAAELGRIRVVGVDRTDLIVWLLSALGAAQQDALFNLPPLLEILRELRDPPDAAAVVTRAVALDRGTIVERGIALIDAVAGDDAFVRELARASSGAGVASAFEWAREGPNVEESQKDLRDAYLVVLCLLQARSGERRPLLRSIMQSRDGRRAALATIARGAWRALPGMVRPAPRPPDVYWLEG